MVRIAYLGTDGCPGHHVIPIRGKFTEEDIKVIESIDCDDFYKVFDVMRFKIAEFKGWTILGIPASLDDHRPGSRRHSDGEKCFGSDDWFIVMAMLPTGQVSNHYESKYWDLFDVPERETSFEYDGHTPNEAADRLEQYLNQKKSGLTFEEAFKFLKDGNMIKRRGWKNEHLDAFRRSGVSSIHVEKSLIIIINEETRRLTSWNPSIEDISSNDWEITK